VQVYPEIIFYQYYIAQGAVQLLQEALPGRFHQAIPEIMVYLTEGFGNPTRIDYGTGHEMSFIMLMCCLFQIGALLEEDKVAAVTHIFNR
jgi:serine/threonine-protein phosphatase 2A activator